MISLKIWKDLDSIERELQEKYDLMKYQKNYIQNKNRMISDVNEMRQDSEEKCLRRNIS